ncbi:MAG: hypothetical protein U5Q44_04000 [Dehalococcoidia bacterium]|nr:hypothetical protein [Dehalococcoidia bacterium]
MPAAGDASVNKPARFNGGELRDDGVLRAADALDVRQEDQAARANRRGDSPGDGVGVDVDELVGAAVGVRDVAQGADDRDDAGRAQGLDGRGVGAHGFADKAHGRVGDLAFEDAAVGAAEADSAPTGAVDGRHDALVDEAGEDGDHDRQDPFVGDPAAALEAGLDAHGIEPAGGLGAAAVDDDRGVALAGERGGITEGGVAGAQGTAADLDDEWLAHVW